MLGTLRSEWGPAMPLPSLVELCSNLDAMLQRIRRDGHILPPMIRCPECGNASRAAEPRVSVRAVILAASRFNIATKDTAKKVEKDWAKYRAQNHLDLYGRPALSLTASGSDDSNSSTCPHPEAK